MAAGPGDRAELSGWLRRLRLEKRLEEWSEAGARGVPGSVPSNKIRRAAEHTFSLIFLTRSLVFPILLFSSISLHCSLQFSSVTQSCLTLGDPMDCSMPGLPVHHQLLEFTQTHVQWVSDAIQPSDPLSSPSPPAFNLSQHQGLFNWVSSLHQIAKVLEFQLQHQSFQWIFRTDFL